jgi:DNA polymerase
MSNLLLDCDYAAIEARIVCWLAGQEDALEEYRNGVKRYERMAAQIYGIPEEQVNKFPQRFVGKEATLGCGFGLGADRFRVQCKKKQYDLPVGLEHTVVKAWRAKHKKVVQFWYALDDAAKNAVAKKGQVFKAGPFISFKSRDIGGTEYLLMRLPSGRKLSYPRPRIVPGKFEGTTAVSFYANIKGTKWGHISTWGGTWAENAAQAVAADIMANGVHNTERAGYETATLIHDQCLSFYHPERGQTVEEFVRLLTTLPPWAVGLPIAAEGSLVPFYKKD